MPPIDDVVDYLDLVAAIECGRLLCAGELRARALSPIQNWRQLPWISRPGHGQLAWYRWVDYAVSLCPTARLAGYGAQEPKFVDWLAP
jgi:hypothetical protein